MGANTTKLSFEVPDSNMAYKISKNNNTLLKKKRFMFFNKDTIDNITLQLEIYVAIRKETTKGNLQTEVDITSYSSNIVNNFTDLLEKKNYIIEIEKRKHNYLEIEFERSYLKIFWGIHCKNFNSIETECVVCFEEITFFDSLHCGHRLHRKCIEYISNKKCPICEN